MSTFLNDFARAFAQLNADSLEQLGQLYDEQVHFSDPLHEVHGLPALRDYFGNLYANVEALQFDFHGMDQVRDGEGYLRWSMRFRHPRLAGGQVICVEGCSLLRWNAAGKVVRHRDYFDAGALLYEHLPLLGRIIRWLKGRLA